ncbi:MAG: arginine N-succinyltransferase [Planctomycetes bacterium]|nr:arginine N-succinyltransferase [Planctomycetota bacterium]
MFLIRQAMPDDQATLLKLAKMVHFLNLPADRDLIAAKIARSRRSFEGQEASEREREYMFVLEDHDTGAVVGTCCVIGRVGWPGWPHVFLQVRRREFWSKDLQQGTSHVTLEFGSEEKGFSEVGGLILAPGYRGHRERLGSMLSLVRFHFMGLHRERFHKRVLAELMGPVTPDSRTLLWEYLGRRFINLSYQEADLFCQHSKEFMTSLWPRGEIHASILPPDARALIGKVGEETIPAKVLLERQGFRPTDHVDPFDGGPYFAAQRDEIPLVKATRRVRFAGVSAKGLKQVAFVSFQSKENGFRAVRCACSVGAAGVRLARSVAAALGVEPGDRLGVTPLPEVVRRVRAKGAR